MARADELISVRVQYDHLRIYIHGLLHLSLNLQDLVAVQSWKFDRGPYYIEYTMRSTAVMTEYDTLEKWSAVLKGLSAIDLL